MSILPVVALLLAAQARYGIHLPSRQIPVGDPGMAELRVLPGQAAPGLGHPGLVVELRPVPYMGEPAQAFPNQRTIIDGGRTIRMQTSPESAGPARLSLRLLDLFPEQLLRPGKYALSFRIEGVNPEVSVAPVEFEVTTPRESVNRLFALLDSPKPALRTAAAALLRSLTGQGFDYDPVGVGRAESAARWKRWWDETGRRMPWKDGVVTR